LKLFPSIILFVIFFYYFFSEDIAQNRFSVFTRTDTIPINFNNHYEVRGISVVPFSESIMLRKKLLNRNDYKFYYDRGYFRLSDSLHYSIFDTLFVTYQSYNIPLKKEYYRRTLVVRYNDKTSDTVRFAQTVSSGFTGESIFGKDMQKSGSIIRGFTVGTTRDFTLTSGLRLQLSGKLTNDIDIVAALTDENTPIQPEGNTERLDELDKVFIEIRHPNAVGTFGDYDLNTKTGEFTNIQRKLQGLKGDFNYENYAGDIAFATSKGKFNTNQYNGTDGVQGPYRLYGINNERDIIIIAGSERVYIDGEEMRRGEGNDYVIEYSNAEVTFTPKRLITSASRITIDFEYTDRQFTRNFFGTSFSTNQLSNKLNVKVNYFREGDDQDSPIDVTLSDSDKKILAAAGDNQFAAVKSGVTEAQPDSTGMIKGTYSRVDTTINGSPYQYYYYNPGNGLYNVSFSYVGDGKGDYTKESLGNYKFACIGKGGYQPVVFLPMPELKQLGSISINAIPFTDIDLNLEVAGSLWDKNRFSSIDDNNNFGSARNIFLNVKPRKINLAHLNLGKIGFSYRDRFIQSKFTSLDRINPIEFSRDYNVLVPDSAEDEQLREASLVLIPFENLNINSTYGYLSRGSEFNSNRFLSNLKLNDNNYGLEYKVDYVSSGTNLLSSKWNRQSGNAFFIWNKIKPGFGFLFEDRRDNPTNNDSLLTGSWRYLEYIPSLELINLYGFAVKAQYSLREESYPVNGVMQRESNAYTQSYDLNYRGIQEVNSSFSLVIRDKKYTPVFKALGSLDNQTILIRSQSRFNFWQRILSGDLYYEATTQRMAKLERVFIRVPQGTGNYKYLGDLNNNGIADDNEFEPTIYDGDYIITTIPTDNLYPVVDLKANTRWKIQMEKVFDKYSFAGKILSPVSTETSFRLEENSKEQNTAKIYLLHFSSFLNDSTTINGFNQFQQDIFLWENSSELSFRFRFSQRKNLNQYSGGLEKGFNKERSVRIRFKMIEEIGNQTEYTNEIDNVIAPTNSTNARSLTSDMLTSDFSYRPERDIEAGFKIGVGRNRDDYPKFPTIINLNSQQLRLNLSFAGTGRLRFEIERNELIANTDKNYLPFELTNGNLLGKNYYWRLSFDYRLSGNLQTSLSYDGRLQGNNKVIHTARAEARAYF
jgi:hypothetical protein